MTSDRPSIVERLEQLGIELPTAPPALGAYVPAKRIGDLVFTSGQLPMRSGELLATGLVFDLDERRVAHNWTVSYGAVDLETARECARQCAVNALAAISTVAELDAVSQVVKVNGFVAGVDGFESHPKVIDAASELLAEVFGEAGRHTRAAVGVSHLPLGAPVELELVVEVKNAD